MSSMLQQENKETVFSLIEKLNPEQKRAALHTSGPLLVIAGAGSGKTRVATLRIANLLANGISPDAILGLTFTNKAAQEMKTRVEKLHGKSVLISTFHSLGARILRESILHLGYTSEFAIYDDDDTEKLLKECARELFGEEAKFDLKAAKSFISDAKNRLLTAHGNDVADIHERGLDVLLELYSAYNAKLEACNAVDFDDLLFLPVKLFRKNPELLDMYQTRWPYVLVDEYQDTNFAQYTLVNLLVQKSNNLFVVGDPDQSIYSWRGANIQNILKFEEDHPGASVIRLEQNYRSTATILEAANAVIQNNQSRYEKQLWSNLGEGEKISVFSARSEREEAEFIVRQIEKFHDTKNIPYSEIVIFYRTNFQSRVFEDALIARRIPYTIVGGISFYLRREIKDILSYLRLIENPKDLISFMRIINQPKRGFGKAFLQKLFDAHAKSGASIVQFMITMNNSFETLPFSVSQKQKGGWRDFVEKIMLLKKISRESSLEELVKAAVFQTGYVQVLDEESESKEERLENLQELIVKAAEWEAIANPPTNFSIDSSMKVSVLSKFLEEIALVSALDVLDPEEERLSLMTVHNGKGLEFRAAFLAGLEEDLFPHINSKKESHQMEEERRLFYVGLTRAKEFLFLSYSLGRSIWGSFRRMRSSRFLNEIPMHLRKFVAVSLLDEEQESDSMPQISPSIPQKQIENESAFEEGDLVFHPQFGIGKIVAVSLGSLGAMYDIIFSKDGTTKRLVAQFAPLKRLDNTSFGQKTVN